MRRFSPILLALALAGASPADATPLFASPPHFLALGDRQQIVLFLNEPIQGAVAAQGADGRIDVFVPGSLVDRQIEGTFFHGDETSSREPQVTSLVLAANESGGTTIRITTARPVGGVQARPAEDPPRLIIELSASRTSAVATPRPATPASASDVLARHDPPRSAPGAAAPARPAPSPASGRADGGAVATRTPAPAMATRRSITTTPRPTPVARRDDAGDGAVTKRDARSLPASVPDDDQMPCRLVRTSGVLFCAPDPAAPPYAGSRALSRLATILAEADADDDLPAAIDDGSAPALYLTADRELVACARSRRLLPAIDAYRRALRRFPSFLDAARARLDLVLAYRSVGFRRELAAAAAACESDPGAPLALAVTGDAALDDDDLAAARDFYERAARAGGVGPCLACRGRAGLAAKTGDAAAIAREVARLPEICPRALLDDADTQRVLARARIAAGDTAGALAILSRVRQALGKNGGALLMEDTAIAAAAAGDESTARHLYEQLAAGLLGGAPARRATLAIARMDAAHGNVAAGLQRLQALGTADAVAESAVLGRAAVARALERGAGADAIALVHEQRLDTTSLPPSDQIRLAAAYRTVGLPGEGERLLARLSDTLGADAPEALLDEQGRCVLARDDAPQALAVADEWLRRHGRGETGAAQALRARAFASLGEGNAARAAVTAAAVSLDPAEARALRVDVAGRVRPHDAAAARDLLQDALPTAGGGASPAETAATLHALADAAEAAGDDAGAIRALTRLAQDYAAQPSAAGAGYRLARLRAGSEGGTAARQAYQGAVAGDALERRVVAASQAYETIVTPFERPVPESPVTAPDIAAAAAAATPQPSPPGRRAGAGRDQRGGNAPRRGGP